MRVQFLWPNFDCPVGLSVGVAYLSGALKQAGHETSIIHICEKLDYPFDVDRIESDIRAFSPDLIAISSGSNHYPEMRQTARLLKQSLGVPIVLGGIHGTLNAHRVMDESPWFDFVNIGEGDDSLSELAAALGSGSNTSSIPNLWARERGEIVVNSARPLKRIDKLPHMDLEGWQFEKITKLRRGWVNVFMNRGCPYRCTYCHNNGVAKLLKDDLGTTSSSNSDLGYLRLRGISDMLAELKSIARKYDCVEAFSFNDDTFTMDREHTRDFLHRYREEIGLPFVCNTTVLDVDRELLILMKQASCHLVRFGVETASSRIKRTILKRDFSVRRTEEVFRICREIGLRSFAFNILANPTETRQETLETLRLNGRLLPDGFRISFGYPFPGTEYHEIASKLHLIDERRHLHNYSSDTILKWSEEDRLSIDKFRFFYFWWVNASVPNKASHHYAELVEKVESMSFEEWSDPAVRQVLQRCHQTLSNHLKDQNVPHYTVPFPDRPDIALLHLGDRALKRETLDEH